MGVESETTPLPVLADVGILEQKRITWMIGVERLSKGGTCSGFMGTII
ncbi:hypothetical protein RV00_GL001041 [Enterococcus devriesei]|uniref:Uncharacterized protein n=1 Tax=Enterococcus devriesei TaxID=319970 RepID=A0A1L8SND0_9ENTE|nr:hypothetical protein RV00_GL001041 [Enterococcus devriesei]